MLCRRFTGFAVVCLAFLFILAIPGVLFAAVSIGEATLAVQAEDTAGNMSEQMVTFTVTSSIGGLANTVQRMVDEGVLTKPDGGTRLLMKLAAAQAAYDNGNIETAQNILNAFINEIEAMNLKFITPDAVDLLITDAIAVRDNL